MQTVFGAQPMQNTKLMPGKFHPCTACNANIPQEDKHTLCARCLGIQHATLALEMEVACSICVAFQPWVKESELERATRRVLRPRGNQGGWEEASQLVQEDTFSIAASFSSDMQVRGELEPPAEEEPGFGVASEASAPLLSISDSALMGRAAAFLQVTWMPAVEPRQSVFRMQAMAPRPQKFPAFPDFMEEKVGKKLGLVGFPPVDSTIAALVKATPVGGLARDLACPNPQYS
ncbi:UNVERIFIED_CONTAM: hypothetical protein FKN15_071649 [Acipenser sinensis]